MVDFPDASVAKIFADRWMNTARLIGVAYFHDIFMFGDGKYHYRVGVEGNEADVNRLMEFINESLSYLDNSELKYET